MILWCHSSLSHTIPLSLIKIQRRNCWNCGKNTFWGEFLSLISLIGWKFSKTPLFIAYLLICWVLAKSVSTSQALIFHKFLNLRDPQLPPSLMGRFGPKTIELQSFIVPTNLSSFNEIIQNYALNWVRTKFWHFRFTECCFLGTFLAHASFWMAQESWKLIWVHSSWGPHCSVKFIQSLMREQLKFP